jgi:hypothetical protein
VDSLFKERGQVLDQTVGQAAAAQEGQGQTARSLQGPVVKDTRPKVDAGLQTLSLTQVRVPESGLVKERLREVCLTEVRLVEVRAA